MKAFNLPWIWTFKGIASSHGNAWVQTNAHTNRPPTHTLMCTLTHVEVPNILLQLTLTHHVYKQNVSKEAGRASRNDTHLRRSHSSQVERPHRYVWTPNTCTFMTHLLFRFHPKRTHAHTHTHTQCFSTGTWSTYYTPTSNMFLNILTEPSGLNNGQIWRNSE